MKNITIFTDPHLGTARQAHTTRESSAALQMSLYHQAMSIVRTGDFPKVCVGDLLDKSTNSEVIIGQAHDVASECQWVLAGNHDETNREGTLSTLRLLKQQGLPIIATPNLTDPFFDCFESMYFVPHHASQEVFEQAMRDAAAHAAENRDGLASYLFLHCNYDFDLNTEDSTLNLRRELAKELIEAFDYIFIGHEHNGSVDLGGQVVVLGNTHPTSFHDIGDKFIYHLELDTATLTKELVWSVEQSYAEIKLGSDIGDLRGIQFVDVTGTDSVANAVEVSEFIREVWKASYFKPEGEEGVITDMFAVRNKVEIKDSLQDVDTEFNEVIAEDLQTRISKDLAGTDLLPLFNELVQKVTA